MSMSSAIADLILERPLCLRCISSKLGAPGAIVEQYLAVVERTFRVHRAHECCRDCGEAGVTVSMILPKGS